MTAFGVQVNVPLVLGVLIGIGALNSTGEARPIPVGTSEVSVIYQTASGEVRFTGDRDYSGVGLASAIILPGSTSNPAGAVGNLSGFNSVNMFGRRPAVANQFPGVIGDDESLMAHAFFKMGNNDEFFPGLVDNGQVTIEVTGIRFAGPVFVQSSTVLFHTLYLGSQADQLGAHTFHHLHNIHTGEALFRNTDEFEQTGVFSLHPGFPSNTVFDDIDPVFTGNGTDTLGVSLTIPYSMFRSLEQHDDIHIPGLPAPQGFLEPFHFHIEYAVVPEPGSLLLLGVLAAWSAVRFRKTA